MSQGVWGAAVLRAALAGADDGYRYVAPTKNAVKPPGEWQTIEIECVGPHIRVWINGEQVQDADQSKVDKIKEKPLKGYVALQSHTNRVEFRNVKLKEIKAAPEK